MQSVYSEEVDENNIVYKQHFHNPREPKKPKERGIVEEYESEVKVHSHHTSDILICGVMAGAIAGVVTNCMETLAVKK